MPPIPGMPPMPPIPPAPLLSSFLSTIMHSVVVISPLTDEASSRATLTTLVGSMIPLSIRLVYSPVLASNPYLRSLLALIFSTTVTPSNPALDAIVLQGRLMAFLMILIPKSCSAFYPLRLFSTLEA